MSASAVRQKLTHALAFVGTKGGHWSMALNPSAPQAKTACSPTYVSVQSLMTSGGWPHQAR